MGTAECGAWAQVCGRARTCTPRDAKMPSFTQGCKGSKARFSTRNVV